MTAIATIVPDLPAIESDRPATPAPARRFTLDGSDELEWHLARVCERVLAGVRGIVRRRRLEALLLGGGYGRGEGGVLRTEHGDQPYNDLEFYAFVRGNTWLNQSRYEEKLRHLAHDLTRTAGAEIEFKVLSLAKLRRSPVSMFYYDLLAGHHWLWGDESLLAGCEAHRDPRNIPLAEATRLLMNRGTGLLFARQKLEEEFLTGEDADFVGRNLAKAQLAFGDAVLVAFGQYHWSCLERRKRLERSIPPNRLPGFPDLLRHHAAGVKFKLHPRRTSAQPATLRFQFLELAALGLQLWLWLEGRRLDSRFQTARDYAWSSVNKCPETPPWRNRLVNAKAFGPLAFFQARGQRHPRERVLNALALLLWGPPTFNPDVGHWLRTQLRSRAGDSSDFMDAYRNLWQRLR